MNNIVSFETTKLLRENGFPQPKPETGQYWYNESGALSFIGRRETNESGGDDLFYCTSVQSGRTDLFVPKLDDAFFAPTPTDILRELPGHNLAFATENGWHCFFEGIDGVIYSQSNHKDNPAEAAALAYLEMKQQ